MPKKPDWLVVPAPSGEELNRMKKLLDEGALHTVCENADCPNIGECFSKRTCTFMILGDICTRNCRFCAVKHGFPKEINLDEPHSIALTAKQLGLKHVVVTSVTRDDLPDKGAGQFKATIRAIKDELPEVTVEVLIPDFKGSLESLLEVIRAKPDVINHNVETVPRLYPTARPQAKYSRSIELLRRVSELGNGICSKSGLMLGLGEIRGEVLQVMEDLREAGCEVLTLGQYLQPSSQHLPVVEYIHPDEFEELEKIGFKMGFLEINAGPLVRSSYNAARIFENVRQRKAERGDKNGHS